MPETESTTTAEKTCCTTEGSEKGDCCGGQCKCEAEGKPKGQGSSCCGGSSKATSMYAVAPRDATRDQIEQMEIPDLVRRYRHGVENFDARVFKLDEAQLDTAFLADAGVGTWPIRVLLGHIADCELAYTHRMRRTVAEENPVLAVFDEQAMVDQNLYGLRREPGEPAPEFSSSGASIAMTHVTRMWTADWLRTLEPQAWERKALHPENGPESVKKMVAKAVWHIEHHARFLTKKLDLMVGPVASGGCCGGGSGGSGGGCGCKG